MKKILFFELVNEYLNLKENAIKAGLDCNEDMEDRITAYFNKNVSEFIEFMEFCENRS